MTKREKTGSTAAEQLVWDVAYRRMKKKLPQSVINTWIDRFSVTELTDTHVTVCYSGHRNLEVFRSRYYDTFAECLFWALEHEVQIDLYAKSRNAEKKGYSAGKKVLHVAAGLLIMCLLSGIAIIGYNRVKNSNFTETYFQVGSGKISDNMRIIQISDLHNAVYGENNSEMVERIRKLSPDLIALTGDIIEEKSGDAANTLALCEQLVEIAPVYFIYGNHETIRSFDYNDMSLDEIDMLLGCDESNRSSEGFWEMEDELKAELESLGVHVLWNEYDTVTVGKDSVDIYGVLTGHPYAFWQYAGETYEEFRYENMDHFKLMLCHEPYIYETWSGDSWADLSLSGHTHGGEVRIPYIGGIFEYRFGWFPEFGKKKHLISGRYDVEGRPLIISNGMSGNDWLRINNAPELVIVDINRY